MKARKKKECSKAYASQSNNLKGRGKQNIEARSQYCTCG
jgi:hypothetical protein